MLYLCFQLCSCDFDMGAETELVSFTAKQPWAASSRSVSRLLEEHTAAIKSEAQRSQQGEELGIC